MAINNQGGGQEFTDATSGGAPIGGNGTANTVAKFTAATSIGNSNITDNGTTVGVAGTNFAFTGVGTSAFAGTTFSFTGSGGATFSGTTFTFNGSGASSFGGTTHSFTGSGAASFAGTTFSFTGSGGATFSGTTFTFNGSGASSFGGTTLSFTGSGAASFAGTTFSFTGSGGATFSGTTFSFSGSGATSFSGTTFTFNTSSGVTVNDSFTMNRSAVATAGSPTKNSQAMAWICSYWDGATSQDNEIDFRYDSLTSPGGLSQFRVAFNGVDQFYFVPNALSTAARYFKNPYTGTLAYLGLQSASTTNLVAVVDAAAFMMYGSDYCQVDSTGIVLRGQGGGTITTGGNLEPVTDVTYNIGGNSGSQTKFYNWIAVNKWYGKDVVTAPGAAANQGLLYFRKVANSKFSLCVQFPTGSEQTLATEA